MQSKVELLFADHRLGEWLEGRQDACKQQILTMEEEQLFRESPETLAERLAEDYRVEAISLNADGMSIEDRGECQLRPGGSIPGGYMIQPYGPSVPGREVAVHIPFSGEAALLRLQPSSYTLNPPQATIGTNDLVLPFQYTPNNRPDFKAQAEQLIAQMDLYLRTQAQDIASYNDMLEPFAVQLIGARRKRILEDREHLDGFGIPVQRRSDAPKTYAAPGIARRAAPKTPKSRAGKPAPIDPTLAEDFYSHIIEVIGAMARGMERTPGDYASWTEEKLRDALLVMLNTHYEGQATGETFNKSGKTDILVRVEDRNVFVDEAKWWSGAAAFAGADREPPSALDQLLAYTTWRDAKLALTTFVKSKDMGKVLKTAREALEAHPAFVAWASEFEGQLRCRVKLPGDEDRGADLAVIFVHLPSG